MLAKSHAQHPRGSTWPQPNRDQPILGDHEACKYKKEARRPVSPFKLVYLKKKKNFEAGTLRYMIDGKYLTIASF